jgi:hypothetical protein
MDVQLTELLLPLSIYLDKEPIILQGGHGLLILVSTQLFAYDLDVLVVTSGTDNYTASTKMEKTIIACIFLQRTAGSRDHFVH